jgi:hypothetical protein
MEFESGDLIVDLSGGSCGADVVSDGGSRLSALVLGLFLLGMSNGAADGGARFVRREDIIERVCLNQI